jgi:hypothetical protein
MNVKSYRGAVGMSFYGPAGCCGRNFSARSMAELERKWAEHRERCPASRPPAPVQDDLFGSSR